MMRCQLLPLFFFFFNDTATTEIYTLSLHDALPICGWMADRWGRMRPLVIAKVLAVAGALLVSMAPDYATILFGRFFVGAAYGIDFAIAMAVLAEFTPARLKSRLNVWQGMWYMAVCSNL